jgi:transcriptional regulator with XRE-family HTH domain
MLDRWRRKKLGSVSNFFFKGICHRNSLSQGQLAKLAGIPRRHISEMENGKRTIGKENAKKMACALGCDYRAFL